MEENRFSNGDRSHARIGGAFLSVDEASSLMESRLEFGCRAAASNPPDICIVTETYPPEINGVALTLANLVNGLVARGNRVSVVHPRPHSQRSSEGIARDCDLAIIAVRGVPFPGYHGLQFGVPSGRLLRRLWRHRPPAAVYVATEGPLGWSAVRVARSLGIPTVSGFHTNFHRYCKHYGVGWLQHTALRYLRWFHNQTQRTLVSSEELLNLLQKAGFKNVWILERGVDSQQFSPQRRCFELRREWGVSDEDIVLLCVGRIAAEKNLTLALEAYRATRRCNNRTKLVIVGDGPLRLTLQRENPEVLFTGTLTGEKLARCYASADLFLFPSETETFGNVTLEAMASGLAVIAYSYAGAKLHITNDETGVLVNYGDAEAFVDSACALVREPQVVRRIKRQAREYTTYLDWPRVVEKFETLLMSAGGQMPTASPSSLTHRRLAT